MKIIRNDYPKIREALTRWLDDAGEIIGTEAVNEVHTHFEEEGVNGQKWQARLPGTPRNDRKLLSDTNTLEDSIRYDVQRNRVEVGVSLSIVPYARIHQEGGEIPFTMQSRKYFWAKYLETGEEFYKRMALSDKPKKVPARPYLVITDRMIRRIEQALITHLNRL